MNSPNLSIGSALSVRGVAIRALIGGGVIAAAAGWEVLRGRAHVATSLPAVHLHAPRWALLMHTPWILRLHIAAAMTAFLIGAALLAGVKGSALHRAAGWTWVVAMGTTAVSSLWITVVNPGHWSFIHFISGWVIIALPMAVVAIRRKNVQLHRRLMTGLFVGGLLVAGAFTFAPGRLMFAVFLG